MKGASKHNAAQDRRRKCAGAEPRATPALPPVDATASGAKAAGKLKGACCAAQGGRNGAKPQLRLQTNEPGAHRRARCLPSPSALAAAPGVERHAFRVGLLSDGSLGPGELSPDLPGGRARARHGFQVANVFARPASPLCSLSHWNLRSVGKYDLHSITFSRTSNRNKHRVPGI